MVEIKIGGIYKHFKNGNTYKVIALAKHSETMEDLVVYEALYDNPRSKIWVWPLSMWSEEVEINGEKKLRFELISDF